MNMPMKDQVIVDEAELKHMIQLLGFASDVAGQLDVMCKIIEEKAAEHSDIKALAHVARCHAENWTNLFDCDREEYQDKYFPKK